MSEREYKGKVKNKSFGRKEYLSSKSIEISQTVIIIQFIMIHAKDIYKNMYKHAGAELCHAQFKLGLAKKVLTLISSFT